MSDTTRHQAVTKLVLAVFRAHQALVVAGDRRVAAVGMNSARWKVLGALELAGEALTASEVARRMGLSHQGALKQLDMLADEKLVERRTNPAHKRAPLFSLTARGRKKYGEADAIWREWTNALALGVAPRRWHDAAALLDTLTARVEQDETEEES